MIGQIFDVELMAKQIGAKYTVISSHYTVPYNDIDNVIKISIISHQSDLESDNLNIVTAAPILIAYRKRMKEKRAHN